VAVNVGVGAGGTVAAGIEAGVGVVGGGAGWVLHAASASRNREAKPLVTRRFHPMVDLSLGSVVSCKGAILTDPAEGASLLCKAPPCTPVLRRAAALPSGSPSWHRPP
jgi:hypothetical protein